MKNLLLFIAFSLITSQFVFGQKEVFQRIKLANKKVEWIEHVDSLGNDIYMVLINDDILYYVDPKVVLKVEVSAWMASSHRGHYLRNGNDVYRIRDERRKAGDELYADKLDGSKFIEPKQPFIVSVKELRNTVHKADEFGYYLKGKKDSILTVVYMNEKDFNSSKLIEEKMPVYKLEDSVTYFWGAFNDIDGYNYLIPVDDLEYEINCRWILKDEITNDNYTIQFDSKPKGFINLYYYDNKLMVNYVDVNDKIQFSSFKLKGEEFIQLSNSTLEFKDALAGYATDNAQTLATLLSRSWYSEKYIEYQGASYHWLTMIDGRGELDFMLIKIVGDDIEWVSYIPRGVHSTTFTNNLQLDGTKKSDVIYEINNGKLIFHDTEDRANFTDEGKFLKASIYISRKRVYTDIIVDLESGKVTRNMLDEIK